MDTAADVQDEYQRIRAVFPFDPDSYVPSQTAYYTQNNKVCVFTGFVDKTATEWASQANQAKILEILLNVDTMTADNYIGIWPARITKLGGKVAPVLDCLIVLLKDTISFVYKRTSSGYSSLTIQEAMGAARDQLCRVTKSVRGL